MYSLCPAGIHLLLCVMFSVRLFTIIKTIKLHYFHFFCMTLYNRAWRYTWVHQCLYRYTIIIILNQLIPTIWNYASLSPPVFAAASTPTTVTAEPVERLGVIRVSWEAPSLSDRELPITGYSIRYKEQGKNRFMYKNDVTATMAEVAGLNANTTYRVYVASVNALGIGNLKYCCERNANRVLVTTYKGKSNCFEVLIYSMCTCTVVN